MVEPSEQYLKDKDGWTWIHTAYGWTLFRHEDQPCYVDLSFSKLEQEYGPLRPLTNYEQLYFRP